MKYFNKNFLFLKIILLNRIENENVIHSLPWLDFNIINKTFVTKNLKFKRQLWMNIRPDVLKEMP